jgi:hypothetical protein
MLPPRKKCVIFVGTRHVRVPITESVNFIKNQYEFLITMFKPETYTQRRNALRNEVKGGIVLWPGNTEAAFNYPANTYHFRQDSTFSYFFRDQSARFWPGLLILTMARDILFGNDVDMDDIIWMGTAAFDGGPGETGRDHPDCAARVNWQGM